MKQIIPLILIILFSHLFFGCDEEQEVDDPIGVWMWDKGTMVSSDTTYTFPSQNLVRIETYKFKEDHTYKYSSQLFSLDPPNTVSVHESGIWETSDTILSLTVNEHNGHDVNGYTKTFDYDIIKSVLILTHIWEDKGVEWTVIDQYSKQ